MRSTPDELLWLIGCEMGGNVNKTGTRRALVVR
jgi:hypothetical protein